MPAERRAWILYRLRCIGLSFKGLARELGCSHQAISLAAAGVPSINIEAVLAERLGLRQRDLFPEHYDARGRRLPIARASKALGQRSAGVARRNAQKTEAA